MPPKPRKLTSYYVSPDGHFYTFNGEDHHAQAEMVLRNGGRHLLTNEWAPEATDAEVAQFYHGFMAGYRAMRDEFRTILNID